MRDLKDDLLHYLLIVFTALMFLAVMYLSLVAAHASDCYSTQAAALAGKEGNK